MKQTIEGGSRHCETGRLRSAGHHWHYADARNDSIGFRLVEDLPGHRKIVIGHSWVCHPATISRRYYHTGKSLRTRTRGIRLVEDL